MAGQRSRRWANLDSVLVHLPVLTDYHDDIQASPDQIEEGGGGGCTSLDALLYGQDRDHT